MRRGKILIITTNVAQFDRNGFCTGLWLGELTHFWDEAEAAGFEMDIASPLGGRVPIDPESVWLTRLLRFFKYSDAVMQRYRDRAFMDRLNATMKVADVKASDYVAIYVTGGHGVMFDLPRCPELARLVAEFWESGRVVSAVCHGVAALLDVKLADGSYLLKDKAVTGFSWNEEIFAERADAAPFNLEEELRERGAKYRKVGFLAPFFAFTQSDGRLITGQNPKSARRVGAEVVSALTASTVHPGSKLALA